MSRKPLLDPNRSYTFSNYFDLNADPFDLVAEFGYFLTRTPLQLPQFSEPLEQVNFLKERIDNILPYVDLTNETARREIFIAPIWQFGVLDRNSKQIEQGLNLYRVTEDIETVVRILLAALMPSDCTTFVAT